jgi:glycosyltransferase involved in cell wall biosynthesis
MAQISIITPTYNRAHLLENLWVNLNSQTISDFQWIVVDDGSTDATRSFIEGIKDNRVTYLYKNNGGVNVARNYAYEFINAPYVTYLDSDDLFSTYSALDILLSEIQQCGPDIGLVSFPVTFESNYTNNYDVLKAKRVIADFKEHICERAIKGEFISVYKFETLKLSKWPNYSGMECLRHWKISESTNALIIFFPLRIYNNNSIDSLSSGIALLNRLDDLISANFELINNYKSNWSDFCPCQIGKYSLNLAIYLSLKGSPQAIKIFFEAFKYSTNKIKIKILILVFILIIPLKYRRRLFLFYTSLNK